MRILLLTNRIPYPPISGSTLRAYQLLKRIARQHEVWLATNLHNPADAEGVQHLEGLCAGVLTGLLHRRYPIAHIPGMVRYAAAGWPLEHHYNYSYELADKIAQQAQAALFDIVQVEEAPMIHYLLRMPPDTYRHTLLSFYDVRFDQSLRLARIEKHLIKRMRRWLYARMMRRWEPRIAERFDRCIVVSEDDGERLLRANPRLHVTVVPNGVDVQAYQPLPLNTGKPHLLFVGSMDYVPGEDAAVYCATEIFPRVQRTIPDAELWLVGSNPPPRVRALDGGAIHVTGRVPEIVPYYRDTQVALVPVRAGGGTRLKILEAMALNRPVVSTTIGCEGLNVRDGEHLLVADDAGAFADAVISLLTDPNLYQRITANGRARVVEHYDWDAITTQLLAIYEEVAPEAVIPSIAAERWSTPAPQVAPE